MLYVGHGLIGISSTIGITVVNSILDFEMDSNEAQRDSIYAKQFVLLYVSEAAAPLVAMMIFLANGNDWTVEVLRMVLYVGVGLYALSCIGLLFFKKKEDIVEITEDNSVSVHSIIPYLIATSDLITALGSGLVTEYFTLYFLIEYDMQPVYVTLSMILAGLCIAGIAYINPYIVRDRKGKIVMSVILDSIGTVCIVILGMFEMNMIGVMVVFVIYSGCINAATPLQRSVIVSIVPKNQRGKWNSLEHINNFAWYCTSALGGMLIDKYGFQDVFLTTGVVYVIGVGLLVLAV